jgi:hypothetical protein
VAPRCHRDDPTSPRPPSKTAYRLKSASVAGLQRVRDDVFVVWKKPRYAWNGDASLAYDVFGEGPVDLVYLQGSLSNVVLNWEHPACARFLRRLSRFSRLIVTDRRGLGCSERFTDVDIPPIEVLVDDLRAVLDDIESTHGPVRNRRLWFHRSAIRGGASRSCRRPDFFTRPAQPGGSRTRRRGIRRRKSTRSSTNTCVVARGNRGGEDTTPPSPPTNRRWDGA